MPHEVWIAAASPAACLVAGITSLAILFCMGTHRTLDGKTSIPSIVASILLGITLYTLAVIVFGQFIMHIPVSTTILERFGNDRTAWLLVGLTADIFARLIRIFYGS
jgi:hypothetical protein